MTTRSSVFEVSGCLVLITGASSGIGRACSIAFGKQGGKIALTGRSEARLAQVKAELDLLGIHSSVFKCDLLEDKSIPGLVKDVENHFGRTVDIVVNSAGIGGLGLVENVPLEAYKETFQLNVFAPIELIRAVLPGMKQKGGGQIINLFSGVGRRGLPGVSPYSSSKFALSGFSESLRVELMSHNIDVILFSPGLVKTNFAANIVVHGELKETFTDGRCSDPDMVATQIVEASIRRRREVTLSLKTRAGSFLNYFFPKLFDRYLSRRL